MGAKDGARPAGARRCEFCGADLPERGHGASGRRARFCSATCRQRAHRRRAAAARAVRDPGVRDPAVRPAREAPGVGTARETPDVGPAREAPDGNATPGTQSGGTAGIGGLPASLDRFVGRERELAELRVLLARTRLLTLVGPGGAGKTRLAFELAAAARAAYPGGVLAADLASLADGAGVARRVAEIVAGEAPETEDDAAEAVAAALAGRRALLVLDGCEHLLDAAAGLAVGLLRRCPGLTVLVTSRQPLEAPGEALFPVPELSLPAPGERDRGELLRSDAVRLFVERARAADPAFELTRGNDADIAEICARLDGNALAIELAARRVRLMPPAALRARLPDRFQWLHDRHADLRASLDRSHDLLTEPERAVLRRTSLLASGVTVDGALALCADLGTGRDEMRDLLGSLQTKSLLRADAGRADGRYHMAESVRIYGRERLAETGEADAAYDRLVPWLLGLAAPLVGPNRLLCASAEVEPAAAELDTLLFAAEWAGRRGDDRQVPLFTAAAACLMWRGRAEEASRALRAALAWAGPAHPGRGAALAMAGVLAALRGAPAEGLALAEQARELEEPGRRPLALARVLGALHVVLRLGGNLAEAHEVSRRCVELVRRHGSPLETAACLRWQAAHALDAGDPDEAAALLEECQALHTALGDGPVPQEWLLTAAMLALERGDPGLAEARLREGLGQHGHPSGNAPPAPLTPNPVTPALAEGLAAVAARRGAAERALRIFAAARALRAGRGLPGCAYRCRAMDEAAEAARAALPDRLARAAEEEGRRMDVTDLLAYALDAGTPPTRHAEPGGLTGRERQVAELVADGLTNREIARRLRVSERTVHTHLERIRAKLDLPSRAHLVRWFLEEVTGTRR
ncbi:putative ATPase/DNA-binding CsgD family transcriptional regulator [Thermocatellispora tengchongensis]|uniref:Putative ATPase/DNA-binding CsgD family transcriptional regulator n=1 Tax=Thermocatellispora tengchongensis TaxID=1073253 RepID=A0A840NT92_9ACTN|nr:LuxR C-terminal-related transcriptional regulator [Thermocatellispora tengchongensis]MBB5131924.1 putative ATPase/DNA-binding CsgD family transcriptional regulator [Thermocatellispora tengchongensis]